MYKDPLLTEEQNRRNEERLRGFLENSAAKLSNPSPVTTDNQFVADLMKHCQGLRALESHEERTKDS